MAIFVNFIKYWQSFQSKIAVFLILCMVAGLFWSRAMLSISIIFFFVNALNPTSILRKFKEWKNSRFAIFCFLFFIVYFISGLWSKNQDGFWYAIANKLPFAVFPFAFLCVPLKNEKWMRILVGGLLFMQTIVVFYSISMLLFHWNFYIKGYNVSHTLPTTKYGDHIRFSLSLVLSLNIIAYLLFEKQQKKISAFYKSFLIFCGILFFLYIHLLAVKTGIVCLYIMLISFVLLRLFKKNKGVALGILLGICTLPILAYQFIPTFKIKLGYVFYEIGQYNAHGKMNYNLSDQGRILSYKVAGSILNNNLLLGTGLGDLKDEMDLGYQMKHPEVPQDNRLIPHNQFLFTFVALGLIFGCVLFLMMYFGVEWKGITSIYSKITILIFIFAFLAEAMLEIQFGVFIYLLFTLFWQQMNFVKKES